jgi:hypothetical protein
MRRLIELAFQSTDAMRVARMAASKVATLTE